jgi:hypothetical protein
MVKEVVHRFEWGYSTRKRRTIKNGVNWIRENQKINVRRNDVRKLIQIIINIYYKRYSVCSLQTQVIDFIQKFMMYVHGKRQHLFYLQ